MASRVEITARYAKAYARSGKAGKGRVLDAVVEVTGWSLDNARRRLTAAAATRPGAGRQVAARPRKPRAGKYSYDAVKVLQRVWAASGGQCGKYLAASMRTQLDGLERHGELVPGTDRYSQAVREELLSMSAATIDRYLKPAKASDAIRGATTTKPSPLLRTSIKVRRAGDEVEAEPGFFEGDTVAHCGPTLKGEFARTLNLTDVVTGWVFTRTMRNNAHVHVLAALDRAVEGVPFAITGLDFDNGISVYFCDPRSPWQRPSNENTNGLLRQYFPKGTDLSRWGEKELQAVAVTLNSRPRKVLHWRTPAEVYQDQIASIDKVGVASTP